MRLSPKQYLATMATLMTIGVTINYFEHRYQKQTNYTDTNSSTYTSTQTNRPCILDFLFDSIEIKPNKHQSKPGLLLFLE